MKKVVTLRDEIGRPARAASSSKRATEGKVELTLTPRQVTALVTWLAAELCERKE